MAPGTFANDLISTGLIGKNFSLYIPMLFFFFGIKAEPSPEEIFVPEWASVHACTYFSKTRHIEGYGKTNVHRAPFLIGTILLFSSVISSCRLPIGISIVYPI